MRFIKKEIRFLISYFDLKSIEYQERIRLNSEFALYLLLCKLLWPRSLFKFIEDFEYLEAYLSIMINDVFKYLRKRYTFIFTWYLTLSYNRIRYYTHIIKRFIDHNEESTI